MRFAIFSDIHGNLEALQAVLRDMEGVGFDHRICLGDLVGYGANPNECVESVQGTGAEVIVGNHDHAATGQLDVTYFNDYAKAAIGWTHNALRPENVAFLKSLPYVIVHPGMRCVHASPMEPEEWDYVLSVAEATKQLQAFEEPICFIGHSHYPGLYSLENSRVTEWDLPDNRAVNLKRSARYLVNVGSVGQPRDNDPRAAWVLYDQDAQEMTLRRVTYDIDGAQAKILAANLPPFLAARLEMGI
jgi:diadenosine tetraphosphatase ApaH/serine/threonine PP2A family protein phosphatase